MNDRAPEKKMISLLEIYLLDIVYNIRVAYKMQRIHFSRFSFERPKKLKNPSAEKKKGKSFLMYLNMFLMVCNRSFMEFLLPIGSLSHFILILTAVKRDPVGFWRKSDQK